MFFSLFIHFYFIHFSRLNSISIILFWENTGSANENYEVFEISNHSCYSSIARFTLVIRTRLGCDLSWFEVEIGHHLKSCPNRERVNGTYVTLLYLLPYLTIRLTLPYVYLTLPHITLHFTLPYVLPYLTIPYFNPTLSYFTFHPTLPYLTIPYHTIP